MPRPSSSLEHSSDIIYQGKFAGTDCVPVSTPSQDKFSDPLSYIDSIRTYGEQYGAVKVVPPAEWKTECQFKDLSKLTFRTLTQSLEHTTSDYAEKVRFYKDLVRFHQKNKLPLVRLPSIDKRVVDLYQLRKSVNAKGGFNIVCQKKQWAQIGRELGYTGRTMTSLSTSLKVTYLKMIQAYDKSLQESTTESSDEPNGENKRPLREVHNEERQNGENDKPYPTSTSPTESGSNGTEEQPQKKQKLSTNGVVSPAHEVSYVSNSRRVYQRSRDILKAKGYTTNFESFTQPRAAITESDKSTYEFYDFNFWHEGIEVPDCPFPSQGYSDLQDFATFYQTHLKNTHLLGNNEEDLINTFWDKMASQDQGFHAETAHNLPTAITGSGFPTIEDLPTASKQLVTDPWNLNNLPLHQDGILRYLTSDQEQITRPRLNISSQYSIQSYSIEDHFLHHIDYNHMGAPRVWYFISPEDRTRYEELLKTALREYRSKLGNKDDDITELPEPIATDIFEGIQQGDQFDVRASATNSAFDKFYEHKPALVRFNSDLVLSPKMLKENNIRLYCTVQYPGEFIIKSPGCYSATVSLGVNLTECVSFAPKSWLNIGLEAEMWLWKQGLLPAFSYHQLLCDIVDNARNPELLKLVRPHFDQFVTNVIQLLDQLVKVLGTDVEILENKFDYISDDSLASCFPLKVVLISGPDSFIIDPRRIVKGSIRSADLAGMRVQIHVYHTKEKLLVLQKSIVSQSQTPADWLDKLHSLLESESRPSLKSLKQLQVEAERIREEVDEARALCEYVEYANEWIEKAQDLLNAKQKSRIRNRRQTKQQADDEDDESRVMDVELFKRLISDIPGLVFTAPEIDQVIELAGEIQAFEASVRAFLTEKDHNEEEFTEMIDLGKSFGVKLLSVDLMERVVGRLHWIKEYEEFKTSGDGAPLEDLKEMEERGFEVLGAANEKDMEHLGDLIFKGDFHSRKVAKALEGSTLRIEDLKRLLETTEGVHLSREVSQKLESTRSSQMKALDILSRFTDLIKQNTPDAAKLASLIKLKNNGSTEFDQIEYNKLIKKFSGAEDDPRPLFREVKKLFEDQQDGPINVGSSKVFGGNLHLGLDSVEIWQRKAKRIFGKVNAPVALLKTHVEVLDQKIKNAFDQEDKYNANRDENDHTIFCVCRRPESGTMICCEKCMEWYHCRCLKFARGKSKEVDNYICPICDYRVVLPKEYNTPTLEDLCAVMEEGCLLKFKPEELHEVYSICMVGEAFREYLKTVLPWDGDKIVGDDINLFKFYLRKLEGASVLLADEYNQLRQLVWKLEPYGVSSPPIISTGNKTKKKSRKPKPENLLNPSSSFTEPAATTTPVLSAEPVNDSQTNGDAYLRIPIIKPASNGEDSSITDVNIPKDSDSVVKKESTADPLPKVETTDQIKQAELEATDPIKEGTLTLETTTDQIKESEPKVEATADQIKEDTPVVEAKTDKIKEDTPVVETTSGTPAVETEDEERQQTESKDNDETKDKETDETDETKNSVVFS